MSTGNRIMKTSQFPFGEISAATQKTASRAFMLARAETKRKAATHPRYEEMVLTSIRELKNKRGVSRPAIFNYITMEFDVEKSASSRRHVNLNLKKLLDKGELVMAGSTGMKGSGSYKLAAPVGRQDAKIPRAKSNVKMSLMSKDKRKSVSLTKVKKALTKTPKGKTDKIVANKSPPKSRAKKPVAKMSTSNSNADQPTSMKTTPKSKSDKPIAKKTAPKIKSDQSAANEMPPKSKSDQSIAKKSSGTDLNQDPKISTTKRSTRRN